MSATTFVSFEPHDAARWGREPQVLQHVWHRSPLFSHDALAQLIERYPAQHYALVATSTRGDGQRRWREGDIAGLPGREVIAAIQRGGLWLNLRNVHQVDERYARLQTQAYAELAAAIPGFRPEALRMGILISSPNAQVHYHADLPGQTLWQIEGRKRIYIYPRTDPFLSDEALEGIALSGVEVSLGYRPEYDAHATVIDLKPGDMAHWPLNSPHRVDNEDCLNISVTTEHWTDPIRRSQMLNVANGVLRRRFGWTAPSRAIDGPGFWAKAAFQAAWRRSPWAQRHQRLQRPIDFRLAPAAGGIIDIPAFYR